MRKRIALMAVIAAAAVAYTAYKKAKIQKVIEHDRKNPLIVTPLTKDLTIPDAVDETPLSEESEEAIQLEKVPAEPEDTEVVEMETGLPSFESSNAIVPESNHSDPFGLDSFIQEKQLPAFEEDKIQPEERMPQSDSEELDAQVEPEVLSSQPEPIVEEEIQPEFPEPIVVEAPKHEIPEPSTLTNTLLESYRIQCKVMMDGYPSNKKIDLIHHIEFKDPKNRTKFVSSLKLETYEIEDSPEGLSATIRQTIKTDARVAYAEIVKLAEASETFHGLYQGWVLVDLR